MAKTWGARGLCIWARARRFAWGSFQQDSDRYRMPAWPCHGCRLSSDAPDVPRQGSEGARQLQETRESWLRLPGPQGGDLQHWESREWRALMPKHSGWEPGRRNAASVSLWLEFVSFLHRAGDSHTWALSRQVILLTHIALQFSAATFFSWCFAAGWAGTSFLSRMGCILVKDAAYVVSWNQWCTRKWGNGTT